MPPSRWFRLLQQLGLEFWLPLPLLGLIFWVGGTWLTDQVLSQSSPATTQLHTERASTVQLSLAATVLKIEASIYRKQAYTDVNVLTADSPLKQVRLELPVTDYRQVEAAIGRELGLPKETIRKLVHYRVVE